MAKKNTDTVPAMLTPGEFVIKKKSAKKIGYGKLNQMNKTGKVNNKKEAKMPQGKGTYGSKVGRPPKKAKGYDTGGPVKEEKKKSKLGSKSKAIPWGGKLPGAIKERRAKAKKEGTWYFGKHTFDKPKSKKKLSKTKTPGETTKKLQSSSQRSQSKVEGEASAAVSKKKAKKLSRKEYAQKIKSSEVYKKAKAKDKTTGMKAYAVGSKERAAEYKRKKLKPDVTVPGAHKGAYKKTAPKGKMKSELRAKEYAERNWAGDDTISQEAIDKYKAKVKAEKKEVKKMQYGGKVSGLKGGNVFDGVEFDEDRMHGGKINKKQFGGKVGGRSGGNVTSEGYPVHGGSGNYKVGE